MEEKIAMSYPNKLGQPCWSPEQVRKVISLTAHTSAESAPYFLAAHSPFERITDAKSSGRQLTEEQVFQELFSPARGEIQAFVKGEPGTGKSHLIRWLKLRADNAKERGEANFGNFTFVLVSRGNGSLKDALSQVVGQLGAEFSHHTNRISGAIDKLSDHAARDTLLTTLALEIGTHWLTRHPQEPMPNALQHLGAALNPTTGFGAWMKRDDGVVHRVIKRLTEDSSVEDREHFPEFSSDEFNVPNTYLRPNTNPGNVIALAGDLAEEDDRRELAAKVLNIALTDAIRALTGLRGSDLLEIFTEIRRDLGPQRQLAVFIEDVSVTGIDQDIINAFEPREVDGLSRMVAILGITNLAWGSPRFPDNQKQRATFVFEVGGKVAENWAGDSATVAAFTARYLNAVRMDDENIRNLAAERFSGDVSRSACDDCDFQEKCFASFGKSELPNGVKIGLFPLNPNAPSRLLASLNEAYYQSQRGLLDRVMLPALDQSCAVLEANEFPQKLHFSVHPPKLTFDWVAFTARYLGGARWNDAEKVRVRFLAEYWTDASNISEAAAQLKPMLGPLGLPDFSSEVVVTTKCLKCGKAPCVCKRPPELTCQKCGKSPCECEDPALKELLSAIETWHSGSNLSKDTDFRKLVSGLLRNSIKWADERDTPITASKTGPERLIDGHAFVKIQDQVSRPANQTFFVNLARSIETKELLESLATFERRGKNWDFPHSEIHKRKISRWLRKNTPSTVESLRPDPPSIEEKSRNCAIQVLALAATLRDRRKMPTNAVECLDSLFAPIWDANSRPCVLSSELEQIISDLETKHAAIRSFVVREFGAGQGDAEPKDFIDPIPILDIISEFAKVPKVEPPPTEVSGGFWKTRFSAVSRLAAYATLSDRIQNERLVIQESVETVDAFTKEAGFSENTLRENLSSCLCELTEVIALQRGGQHRRGILPLPNQEFDQLWERRIIQTAATRESLCVAVGRAVDLLQDNNSWNILTYDPTKFKDCIDVINKVEKFLDLVDRHITYEENQDGVNGDSRSLLLDVLKQIEEMSSSNEKENLETDEDL